jgi:hypothetical protein
MSRRLRYVIAGNFHVDNLNNTNNSSHVADQIIVQAVPISPTGVI